MLGLGWLSSDPPGPFSAQYHRITGVAMGHPYMLSVPGSPVSWVQSMLGYGAKEGKKQGVSPPLCKRLREWLFLRLSKTASICNNPLPASPTWGSEAWLSAVDNFWTTSSSLLLSSWFFHHLWSQVLA